MATIEVIHGAGDRRGNDIIEPLLSDSVLIVRGRAEIYEHAYQVNSVTIEALFKPNIRLGNIIAVASGPENFVAKITGIAIEVANIPTHKITVERIRWDSP